MSEPVARFAGPVSCERSAGAVKLLLIGACATAAAQPLRVGFATAPAALPAMIHDAVVEETSPGMYRIAAPEGEWTLAAPAAHVHREVGATFYRAIPPRPVPLRKRVFWRLVLMLAASRSGLALLRSLRGSG